MRVRRPGKASGRRTGMMSWRVVGVCSATLLALGLLSTLIGPAAARTATVHAPAPPRSAARPWPQARRVVHGRKSTRSAPFLSWAGHRSFTAASIVHTYRVTTTADTTPASCPATTEPCTLRQAITQANADGTLDKIVVPAATTPYLLESDQLTVTDPAGVVISGAGQTKTLVEADTTSSSYPFRVLEIDSGSNVQISGVSILNGHSSTTTEDGFGGGIEVLSGALTLSNSTVASNTADEQGGGIYVAGLNSINGSSGTESQAYLKGVTIVGNSAGGINGGGGLDVEGQAVSQGGSVTGNTVTGSNADGAGILLDDNGDFIPSLFAADLNVSANTGAIDGGGIANFGHLELTKGAIGGPSNAAGNTTEDLGGGLDNGDTATLSDVAVRHNTASGTDSFGGGIENTNKMLVTGGSISGNSSDNEAGGLDNYEAQATLDNVKVSGNRAGFDAGGVYNEGSGPFFSGTLSVRGGSIAKNSALDGDGGGLVNIEPASVQGTSITGNTASSDGGGIFSDRPLTLTGVQLGTAAAPNVAQEGGGLFTQMTGTTIVRSRIEGNKARDAGSGSGGGIFNTDFEGPANDQLRQTTVADNSSDGVGGGIANFGGTMSILTSTISANRVIAGATDAFGGGISNFPDTSHSQAATLDMVNDTLTGNRAGGGSTPGFGGGLDNEALASATLTNVTVSRNRAGSTGSGGGIYNNGGVAALRGTLLAWNTASHAFDNCGLLAALSSNGYNLSTDTTCGLTGIGDQTGVNPKLAGLAHNGGPTETEALQAGSPAIDAVKFCPPPKTDQRGVNRESPCDVGAYERVPDK